MKNIKRALLKLSGGALAGKNGNTFDFEKLDGVAKQIIEIAETGIQLGIVLGGGNIWRGRSSGDMDRTQADNMGMLATTINSLALQDALERQGKAAAVVSSIEIPKIADSFNKRRAEELFAQGKIVILAGGTGNPFFSTDTAAVLRALEIDADIILMAKDIDAVYNKDPRKYPDAVRLPRMTYSEIYEKQLQVVDMTSAVLCMEHDLDTFVFGLSEDNNMLKALNGEDIGTYITK
ncbi:MAG: UMP kinase [Clostridia bacterium]|nr:UMP kinase [Clostridia bacterium]